MPLCWREQSDGKHNIVHADTFCLASLVLGQNRGSPSPPCVLKVFRRNFHSKLQGSPEPRHKTNYVKYSDLLVQKFNAVLELSVCVAGAMQGYKILILRLSPCTRSISDHHLTVKLRCFCTTMLQEFG